MSDEETPIPEEVLTSAKDQLDDEAISLADNEEILHALSELTPVYENEQSYFVLGNYDREPIRRLNLVVDRLNRRQNTYAFRMVDIRGESPTPGVNAGVCRWNSRSTRVMRWA
mgnify:CR=1 FL=1